MTLLRRKKIKYYKDLKEVSFQKYHFYFLNTKLLKDENNNSNVLYFHFKGFQFLLMGDAEELREKEIINHYHLKDIDFLQVGHHGSNTSSSKEFIDRINPKKCFISVGKNNRYGHPKDSVIEILDDYCDIDRTDLNGSIEVKINKDGYKVNTCSQ